MNINISNTSGQPIYDQISKQVRAQIMSGELAEGELLPSMRMLAKELRISVITTKRAYEELERDGFIATVAGKGSFVAPKNLEFMREEHLRQIEGHMREVLALAKGCRISVEELHEMLEIIVEEE